MTDRPDLRVHVLKDPDWAEWIDLDDEALSVLLDDLDDADEVAGIVRVDTSDDLEGALDMLTSILRADIGTGFRDGGLRLTAALDRVERLLVALREEA